MVLFLSGIIVILLIANLIQYRVKKTIERDMKYITAKLYEIVDQHSSENVLVVTDYTALKSLLVAINRLLGNWQHTFVQYTKKERSIKKMLANVSHDLKTPLTVVLGYIEMMQRDEMLSDKERSRMLAKIHHKVIEIIKLMNTFFDLAKLEAGDKRIPLTPVSMNEVCKRNMLQFYDLIQEKGLEAIVDIDDESLFTLGNEEVFDRVLHNLLSNAIRYGSDGGVIGLHLSKDEQQIFLKVWDQGQGIEEKDQARVFERLFTLDEARNKSFQGSGLGLTITKRLVEEMGGSITLDSVPYEKTIFTVTFNKQ